MSSNGEEIDVDAYGRVLIEHPWDRRDVGSGATSRRVRVAQGWAGAGFGFVMLPRVGEEVVIAYLDGDPDEPLVVGRVHNALVATPLDLPGDKTLSVWRSRSSPGSDGYNQILMDDAAGAERLEMHAQHDFTQAVGNDAARTVVGNDTSAVQGDQSSQVQGDQSGSVDGDKDIDVKGALAVNGKTILVMSASWTQIVAGEHLQVSCGTDRDDDTVSTTHWGGRALHQGRSGGARPLLPGVRGRGDPPPGRRVGHPHHGGRDRDQEHRRREDQRRHREAELLSDERKASRHEHARSLTADRRLAMQRVRGHGPRVHRLDHRRDEPARQPPALAHETCCTLPGPNAMGAATVWINGEPAVGLSHGTRQPSGSGRMVEASADVFIGGPSITMEELARADALAMIAKMRKSLERWNDEDKQHFKDWFGTLRRGAGPAGAARQDADKLVRTMVPGSAFAHVDPDSNTVNLDDLERPARGRLARRDARPRDVDFNEPTTTPTAPGRVDRSRPRTPTRR